MVISTGQRNTVNSVLAGVVCQEVEGPGSHLIGWQQVWQKWTQEVSMSEIGRKLGRCASTTSRKLTKNNGALKYQPVDAHDRVCRRARRPHKGTLAKNPMLRGHIFIKTGRRSTSLER